MAFINEQLTTEQRTKLEQRGIKNPNPQRTDDILRTRFWTADFDNDMYLVGAGVYREFPDETYFVFINKSNIIRFVAKMHSIIKGSIEWEICRLIDERHLFAEDMGDIESALSVFQVFGYPEESNTKVSVTFSIKSGGNRL